MTATLSYFAASVAALGLLTTLAVGVATAGQFGFAGVAIAGVVGVGFVVGIKHLLAWVG